MSVLWTSEEIERATLGKASVPFTVSRLVLDSRKARLGDLYLAVKGDSKDGHDFIAQAFTNKAAAALVSRAVDAAGPVLTVAHTQRALEDLARAARARAKAKVVAVTGSAGKTTTKEVIAWLIEGVMPVGRSAGNFNNHVGLPLSILRLPSEAPVASI